MVWRAGKRAGTDMTRSTIASRLRGLVGAAAIAACAGIGSAAAQTGLERCIAKPDRACLFTAAAEEAIRSGVSHVQAEIVGAMAEARAYAQAEALAARIDDRDDRAAALIAIALGRLRDGDPGLAEAVRSARAAADLAENCAAKAALAPLLVATGAAEAARTILGPEAEPICQSTLWAGLARGYLKAGDSRNAQLAIDRAVAAARSLPAASMRAAHLAAIVRVLAESAPAPFSTRVLRTAIDEFVAAMKTERGTTRGDLPGLDQEISLASILLAHAVALGDPRAGAVVLGEFERDINRPADPEIDARRLAWLAAVYAEIGDRGKASSLFAAAARAIGQIDDPTAKDAARGAVAAILARAGMTGEAMAAVPALRAHPAHGQALAELARALAETGQLRLAREVLASTPPALRAPAAIALWHAYLKAGESAEAASIAPAAIAGARFDPHEIALARALAKAALLVRQ